MAETEIPLAADLLAGDSDPRSHVVTLLGRALAALPQQVRDGAKAAGRKIALRADAGYFAGDLARAAIKHEMEFAIGAKRISSMWRALAGIDEDAWRDAIDMPGAQVAVSPYKPAGWPSNTVLLIRRVRLDPDQVSPTRAHGGAAPSTRASGRCRSPNWSKNRRSTPTVSSAPTWTCPPRPGPPLRSTGTATAP